ncbi:MAG: DUF1818 family protein [Cyanobacteria bacterium J06623_4]
MLRQLLTGEGWRLGWNPNAGQFYGLLGGELWALELTAVEFQDFCTAVRSLKHTMAAMAEQLMAEERLTCEQETETIWLEAEGFPSEYSLRFILLTGRRGEGGWPAVAVPGLLGAVEKAIEQLPL